jgi:hypothetical protein
MTSEEKAAAKRLNEQFKAGSSFMYNASLTSFVAGFGLWYSAAGDTYWILAGALAGLTFGGFAIALLQELRPEE